jgi:hypothetical protein
MQIISYPIKKIRINAPLTLLQSVLMICSQTLGQNCGLKQGSLLTQSVKNAVEKVTLNRKMLKLSKRNVASAQVPQRESEEEFSSDDCSDYDVTIGTTNR